MKNQVAEIKKRMRNLEEELENYRSIVELSPDGIITLDLQGYVLSCNQSFLDLTGYTREEIISQHISALPAFPKADLPQYLEVFQTLIKKRKPARFEFSWIHKDQSLRAAEAHVSFHRKKGKIVGVQAILRDNTERKRVDKALKESEEWQRSLFEGSRDAIFIVDHHAGMVDVNQAAVLLTGYSREELLSMRVPDLHAPEDLGAYDTFFKRIMGGEALTSAAKILRKDGSKVETEFSNRRITVAGIPYMHTTARDMTARIESERMATQLGHILEDSVNEIYIFNAETWKFVLVNRGARENLGYSMKELKKLTPLDLKPDFSAEAFSDLIAPLQAGKVKIVEFITRHRRKDGSFYPVEVYLQLNEFNLEPVFVAIILDISQRRRTESALQESEKRYRALFEFANDAIFLMDRDGFYVKANKKAADLLGYKPEELVGKSAFDSIDPEELAESRRRLISVFEGETFQIYERRFQRRDGSKFPAEINVSLIHDAAGKPVLVQSIVRDISERKKAEAKIKDSLKEKEVMLQEIHHRVKNNMQIVSSLLRLQCAGIKDAELLSRFEESQNRIQSMALIHEKLYQSQDYSRINFGHYIRDLVGHLKKVYEVDSDKILTRMAIEDILLDINMAVPCGLIVNELVTNVFKHAYPCGRSGKMDVYLKKNGEEGAYLRIKDDGSGFSPDLEFQNPKTLGLQLVQSLVRQIAGKIQVIGNGGCDISIEFPISA